MRHVRLLTSALSLVLIAGSVSAQTLPAWARPSAPAAAQSPPTPGGTPGTPPAPTQVPLEGGLGLLALAGAGLAARRLRQTD